MTGAYTPRSVSKLYPICWLITVYGGTLEPPGRMAAGLCTVRNASTTDMTIVALKAPARQNAGSRAG